jgi:hypothetical protein
MRRIPFILLALFFSANIVLSQSTIDKFEYARPDTILTHAVEGNKSLLTLTQNTSDKKEGTSSMEVNAVIGAYHPWGSYATFGSKNPGNVTEDWSLSDSISIWLKVKQAPKQPEYMVFRIQIADQPTASDPIEEYIYENATIIDATSDWVELKVPLIERNQPGNDVPDNTGFILVPTGWGGFTYNNKKLDRDKIYQWTIGIVTSGWTDPNNIPADSVVVLFDNFVRFGTRAVPVVIFNGKDFTGVVNGSPWAWGQSSASVEQGAGPLPKTNAIKWVQGDEWNNGWTGWGVNLYPQNMIGAWAKDSLKFKMKCDTGVGDLRVQLEGNGKRGTVFTPIADNQWHNYSFALRDMYGPDGTPTIDSGAITVFGIMAQASAKAGKVIYITDIWTGNPTFDVIAPDTPTGLSVLTSSPYENLIIWTDLTNENGKERYNVYYGSKPWTTVDDTTITDIPFFNQPHGVQLQTHLLRSALVDKPVTYYYGIVAKDEAGNLSNPAFSGAVTNTAKGVPTISMTPPTFVADGDLSEWSNITPFVLSINGVAHVNENGTITGDADLSAKAYYAVDNTYLYVAYDVTDDKVMASDSTVNSYENDSPDLYIGLYDWVGKWHSGLKTGNTPDYHIRFAFNRALLDNNGKTLMYPGANYIFSPKVLDPGYTVEARIPLSVLEAALGGVTKSFVPVNGMRIPIDIVINDRDDKATHDLRDGMLIYSPVNTTDASWQDMWRWTYTWTGTGPNSVPVSAQVTRSFELDQNYPNPFNPATQIRFSLATAGHTTLKVYDVLGRVVATLIDGYQEAGSQTVVFNGKNLSSGLYFYKIESGSFNAVKKMMLVK